MVARSQEDAYYHPESECREPEPCQEFQTARLILSHLGLLNIGALRVRKTSNNPPGRCREGGWITIMFSRVISIARSAWTLPSPA